MVNPQPACSGATMCIPTTLAPAQYAVTGFAAIYETLPWQVGARPSRV